MEVRGLPRPWGRLVEPHGGRDCKQRIFHSDKYRGSRSGGISTSAATSLGSRAPTLSCAISMPLHRLLASPGPSRAAGSAIARGNLRATVTRSWCSVEPAVIRRAISVAMDVVSSIGQLFVLGGNGRHHREWSTAKRILRRAARHNRLAGLRQPNPRGKPDRCQSLSPIAARRPSYKEYPLTL
jgi:hypothetical protein